MAIPSVYSVGFEDAVRDGLQMVATSLHMLSPTLTDITFGAATDGNHHLRGTLVFGADTTAAAMDAFMTELARQARVVGRAAVLDGYRGIPRMRTKVRLGETRSKKGTKKLPPRWIPF